MDCARIVLFSRIYSILYQRINYIIFISFARFKSCIKFIVLISLWSLVASKNATFIHFLNLYAIFVFRQHSTLIDFHKYNLQCCYKKLQTRLRGNIMFQIKKSMNSSMLNVFSIVFKAVLHLLHKSINICFVTRGIRNSRG